MDLTLLANTQINTVENFPTSKTELLFIGFLMVSIVSLILLLLLFSSSGKKKRKEYDEIEEREQIVKKIEKEKPQIMEDYGNPEAVKAVEWMKHRRKYLKKRLAKLEVKKINMGLSPEEEIKKKFYEQELFLIQQELLTNDAFLAELSRKADWALEQALNGTPSREIRKKLVSDGYTKKEIEIIKIIFNKRKEELKKVGEHDVF